MTRDQIRRAIPYVLVVTLSVALYAAGRVETSSKVGSVNSRVSRVESPCLKYGPKSKLCQRSFESALGTLTHPEACAVERKAGTLRALRELADSLGVEFAEPCRGARLAQERKRGNERRHAGEAAVPASRGGDASDAQTGSSQPGRHEGGSGSETDSPSHPHAASVPRQSSAPVSGEHGSGGEDVPSPAKEASPTSSQSSSSQTTERVESTVVETAPEAPKAPVPEAVGGVVESVGGTVTRTVEDVTEPVCSLAKLLCP